MSSAGNEELGFQLKPMGLKVHYTFDKDSQDRCLARHPQVVQAQTLTLDEKTTIGLVDISRCLQAVIQCSPELVGSPETDYVVYAYDYSEPDTPLVGQGVLSWLLDPSKNENANGQSLSMVTGLVTKNLLALFSGNGIKETLEVKLKLVQNNKIQRPGHQSHHQHQHSQSSVQSFTQQQPQQQLQLQTSQLNMSMSQGMDTVHTPTAEWNYFMSSIPQFGNDGAVGSPLPMDDVSYHSTTNSSSLNNQPAATVTEGTSQVAPARASSRAPSRPSSRASKKRQPTGRPRGRPRKRPLATEGNTSGYEDGTDGDEGPANKKRIASTVVGEVSVSAPFAGTPDSLRVAASTSGSLRNFRPLAVSGEGSVAGSHLQDVPRAPTPVPNADKRIPGTRSGLGRRPSTLGQEQSNLPVTVQAFLDSRMAFSPPNGDDARSPSIAVTPAAFSDDSGAEIGSSPPVPRTSRFMQSSPPPSSPILPPMPQPDSGFMSGGMEETAQFEEAKLQGICPTDAPSAAAQVNDPTPARAAQPPSQRDQEPKIPIQIFSLKTGMVQISNPYSHTPLGPDGQPVPRQRSRSDRRGSQPGSKPPPLISTENQKTSGEKANEDAATPVAPTTEAAEPEPEHEDEDEPQHVQSPVPANQAPTPAPAETAEATPAPSAAPPVPTTAPSPLPVKETRAPSAPAPALPMPAPQSRQLNRSHSMGPLALPLPSFPDESTSATSTSTSDNTSSKQATSKPGASSQLAKSASFHDLPLPIPLPSVPASDPVGPPQQGLPMPSATSFSEAPCPPSDSIAPPVPTSPSQKSNKNYVKKQSIKERLERAIANGEMPPFCTNCGAIETPTWRKISSREFVGVPEYVEYSEKPGCVTAIEIISRDGNGRPSSYRLIKKSLGPEDDKSLWTEMLLCNREWMMRGCLRLRVTNAGLACGIWLSKNNKHRPPERWEKDRERLGQERRKRGTGRNPVRNRKRTSARDSRSGTVPPLTSEACFPPTDDIATDAIGTDAIPTDAVNPPFMEESNGARNGVIPMDQFASLLETVNSHEFNEHNVEHRNQTTASGRSGFSNARSTHTRGTGTANSPIALDLDDDLGSTRRLLFPSPRHKSGTHRDPLNPVSPNIVTPTPGEGEGETRDDKDLAADAAVANENEYSASMDDDDLDALFGSKSPLPPRPSTPPPKESSSATRSQFRTPSRPTPSHRPLTRSITRSIQRSVQSSPILTQLELLQTTPTRTPRSRLMVAESPSLRRSPRINGSVSKYAERERRMKALEALPNGDIDGSLHNLGAAIANPFGDQAEIDAILDKCLSTAWPMMTPRKGGGWDDMGDHDWDLENMESLAGDLGEQPAV
ncbi:hypothetical protein jhhlp_004422 [Lomentospora prolificans]|uniref:Ams2/SPT21 N-terminal domain-containing protein n=1 Tax=Lomentospora prolificans TaxID=41688 RepID=A0A2N3NBI7_9PEZI|nr:hypothetical protein jhhlp_004422 [Lomentospora prolificans]